MRLRDKVAVITGGARGIGKAIAIRFAQEGACVVVDDINDVGGQGTAEQIQSQGGKAIYVHADVSKEEDVQRLMQTSVDTFGKLNVLVCNAICSAEAIWADEWAPNLEVSLKGAYLCCKAAIPHMKAAGGGCIINMSSVNALMGIQGIHLYSAAKGGIVSMSRSMATWHARDQIRVNVICPGSVRTEVWDSVLEKNPNVFDELKKYYPLGRIAEPVEIANIALFLASDESSFVTGHVLIADGGLTAGFTEFGYVRES